MSREGKRLDVQRILELEAEVEWLREAIKRHRHANVVVGREQPPEIDQTLYAALADEKEGS